MPGRRAGDTLLARPARRVACAKEHRGDRGDPDGLRRWRGCCGRWPCSASPCSPGSIPLLRQQVDLDTLTAELLAVVEETMQPTRMSIWLTPAARGKEP
jgi:hypothetical protein